MLDKCPLGFPDKCPLLGLPMQGVTRSRHQKLLQNCTTVTDKTLENVVKKHGGGRDQLPKIIQRSKEQWIAVYLSIFHPDESSHSADARPSNSVSCGGCSAVRDKTSLGETRAHRRANQTSVKPDSRTIRSAAAAAGLKDIESGRPEGIATKGHEQKKRKEPEGGMLTTGETVELECCSFEVGAPMAAGADSTIFEGTCTGGKFKGTAVAIKVQSRGKKTVYQITTEFTTLMALSKAAAIPGPPLHAQRALAYGAHRDACYVLVTERLGPNLLSLLPPSGRMAARNVLLLAHQAVPLLQALHARGFVHRDIKPENLVLGPAAAAGQHQLHLIDFGTAEPLTDRHGRRREQPQAAEGTLRYMSLSAHDRRPVSPRDDLESLGWSLLRLRAGPLPWEACSARQAADVVRQKRRFLADGAAAALATWPGVAAGAAAGAAAGVAAAPCEDFMVGFFAGCFEAVCGGGDGAAGQGDYGGLAAAAAAAWRRGSPKRDFGRLPPPDRVVYRW